MITATWKKGFESFYKGVSAQDVTEEIMAIGDDATPQQIVEKAKDDRTQLHRCFTWDNDLAAEKWRVYEARQLVCRLVIYQEDVTPDEPEVRVFHKNEVGPGYKAAPLLFRVDDEYQKLLQAAYAELRAFKRKYARLQELEDILALIDLSEGGGKGCIGP